VNFKFGIFIRMIISRRMKWTLMGQIVKTVEFHFSGLIGNASHPKMQKVRLIGIFFGSYKFGC
jgi:hypothetical protein